MVSFVLALKKSKEIHAIVYDKQNIENNLHSLGILLL